MFLTKAGTETLHLKTLILLLPAAPSQLAPGQRWERLPGLLRDSTSPIFKSVAASQQVDHRCPAHKDKSHTSEVSAK